MAESKILAIETSADGGSVALAVGGTVATRAIDTAREQTARLLPMIDALIAETGIALADLDAVAFGQGPGSFTGLRVAAAVAQGIGLATGVAIVPVSSMAGLSVQVSLTTGSDSVLVCLDARMDEVYYGHYRIVGGIAQAVREPAIGPPAAVPIPPGDFVAAGDAFARYPDALGPVRARATRLLDGMKPRAEDLIAVAAVRLAAGQAVRPAAALPVYLRDSTAWRRP